MSSGTRLLTLNMQSGKYHCRCVTPAAGGLCAHFDCDLLRSKTVTALDVVYALKRSGRTLYGFGA